MADARGVEVEARADEFFAVFEAPRSAVDAAVAMQLALRERSFIDGAAVRIRIGIHSGYPTRTAGNYVGLDVNVARSRVTALGHGGQIVVTANTREAVRATSGRDLRFVALGAHRLRGLREPMELFQVGARGLTARFPRCACDDSLDHQRRRRPELPRRPPIAWSTSSSRQAPRNAISNERQLKSPMPPVPAAWAIAPPISAPRTPTMSV